MIRLRYPSRHVLARRDASPAAVPFPCRSSPSRLHHAVIIALSSSSAKHPVLAGLTTPTMPSVRVVAHAPSKATICTVHKSPSPTVVENWLATVVSAVAPTVPGIICFQVRPGPSQAGPYARKSPVRNGNGCLLPTPTGGSRGAGLGPPESTQSGDSRAVPGCASSHRLPRQQVPHRRSAPADSRHVAKAWYGIVLDTRSTLSVAERPTSA
jgi:hypothetical protein